MAKAWIPTTLASPPPGKIVTARNGSAHVGARCSADGAWQYRLYNRALGQTVWQNAIDPPDFWRARKQHAHPAEG